LIFDEAGAKARDAFLNRLTAFIEKALRESKRHTSWTDQNADYEGRARRWTERALRAGGPLDHMTEPLRAMALAGSRLSVARAVLKCALPGCPDLYQGTEQLDFSLVDPDNRRPVDYASRAAGLDAPALNARFSGGSSDGALKQQAIARMLADRQASPDLYGFGSYDPIELEPSARNSLIAFRRSHGSDALVVVARLRFMGPSSAAPLGQIELEPGRWRNLLTGGTLHSQGSIPLDDALETWPAIALKRVN
jgi:(1->4)-alpha-D-glucan 1-alpha-D-glucosylmutase